MSYSTNRQRVWRKQFILVMPTAVQQKSSTPKMNAECFGDLVEIVHHWWPRKHACYQMRNYTAPDHQSFARHRSCAVHHWQFLFLGRWSAHLGKSAACAVRQCNHDQGGGKGKPRSQQLLPARYVRRSVRQTEWRLTRGQRTNDSSLILTTVALMITSCNRDFDVTYYKAKWSYDAIERPENNKIKAWPLQSLPNDQVYLMSLKMYVMWCWSRETVIREDIKSLTHD